MALSAMIAIKCTARARQRFETRAAPPAHSSSWKSATVWCVDTLVWSHQDWTSNTRSFRRVEVLAKITDDGTDDNDDPIQAKVVHERLSEYAKLQIHRGFRAPALTLEEPRCAADHGMRRLHGSQAPVLRIHQRRRGRGANEEACLALHRVHDQLLGC